ncbi:hypothetical protein [Methylophilus sp. DW102]|uniref:helix-turn-helix transcriptional regulator n=1 Tax=Methylophilus sp. DW102 TaxID=3095607 RepID=UPI0030878AE3|nr:hypothetical protein MTDW_02400 [Methylophilus sp. DW102]
MMADLSNQFWDAHPQAFVTRQQVAAALNHTVRWLHNEEAAGKTPQSFRVGIRVLYRKSDIIAQYFPDSKNTG